MSNDKEQEAVTEQKLEPGVYVTRYGTDKVMAFVGTFDCQLTNSGDMAIVELVPDVANENGGTPTARVRRFIAHGEWKEAILV
jgi:hypothetical protein